MTQPPVAIHFRRLRPGDDLPAPQPATADSAGVDLRADIDSPRTIQPGSWERIPSGLAVALPRGYEAQVRPRSGLAARYGITVLNAPGTVDADYRGEIEVVLINHSRAAFRVERGMRIAQLVVAPVLRCDWIATERLDPTDRGSGGFGSTGR